MHASVCGYHNTRLLLHQIVNKLLLVNYQKILMAWNAIIPECSDQQSQTEGMFSYNTIKLNLGLLWTTFMHECGCLCDTTMFTKS